MWYRVLVHGRNVWLRVESGGLFRRKTTVMERNGFYSTRVVSASSREEARELAFKAARDELAPNIANDPDDPPILEVEDEARNIEELTDGEWDGPQPKGFTFYPDS